MLRPQRLVLLARAPQALSDPLFLADVSVCVSATLVLLISRKLSDLRKVPTARRFVTSSTTSRDYDVILVTSRYSSHSETRTRINYPFETFKHTVQSQNIVIVFKVSSFG